MADDSELVYSTDPERNQKCLKCKKLMPECVCAAEAETPSKYDWTAKLRTESAGRGGKTVTVIADLPPTEKFLDALARTLKTRCGSGGTYFVRERKGVIEIQGDKRELIRSLLAKEGIRFKG